MQVWGITPVLVEEAVRRASELYDGNVICDGRPGHTGSTTRSAVHFKLRVVDSSGPGAKITVDRFGSSKKGYRRTVAACWHAHRDVMIELFKFNQNARIKTVVADYRGADNFEATFPSTGNINIGSIAIPVELSSSCLCHEAAVAH